MAILTLFHKVGAVRDNESQPGSLEGWYRVSFDEHYIYRHVSPPGKQHWKDALRWDDIIRVCFLTQDLYLSDEI
ncbi:MAG TPA: hypothetical protein VFV34_16930 [Blastocatellia bacterium]|nr:hypothetical protein [Blastocatellia bacterium]